MNIIEAVKLLSAHTFGTFNIGSLAGAFNASRRQQIMLALTGKMVARQECGINALRDAFYAVAQPKGNCAADTQDAFCRWCREQLGTTPMQEQFERLRHAVAPERARHVRITIGRGSGHYVASASAGGISISGMGPTPEDAAKEAVTNFVLFTA